MFSELAKWIDGKERAYVSETDKFLTALEKQYPKLSASQRHEIDKHRNIFNRKKDHRVKW